MKLRVHFLSRGRYWKAGEEIPDEEVPPNVRKYSTHSAEPVPKPPTVHKQVAQLKAGKRIKHPV